MMHKAWCSLPWRHIGRDSVSNHQPHQCLLNRLFKENIKARCHWPLCGEFTRDRWIPRTNDQLRGKCFHLQNDVIMCLGEVPYYFSRPSIKFRGHTGKKKVVDFPDCNSSLNSPMATKWCTKLEVALKRCRIVFQGHPPNFKAGDKIDATL